LLLRKFTTFYKRREKLIISEKAPVDFVTQVDKKVETILVDTISESFPDHSFQGEELGFIGNPKAECKWIIDPLDGTTNFIHGFPYFSISIACHINGKPEHAIIVDVSRNDEFTASKGKGAYLNQTRIRVSKIRSLRGSLLSSSSHLDEDNEPKLDQLMAMRNLYSNGLTIRRTGSTALDLAYVAAGYLDGFWGYGLKQWDVAAGILLVKEAGGLVNDLLGNPDPYDSHHLIACSPKCMPQMIKAFRDAIS
jgi:myo-inositol-1(or 4)-monophosphatase